MNTPIKKALDALALAKECGGELDLQYYSESHAALDHVVQAARAYDASLNAAEQPPTGEDYEHIMSLLGLRTCNSIDDPEVAIAAAIEKAKQSDENVRRLADVLGLDETAQTDAVPIEVDAVDVTQSWIGGEDVAPAAATLDLHTGRVALVDHSLGHPLLVADGTCVIRYAGKEYSLPFVTGSAVPIDLVDEAVIERIKTQGYWAIVDLSPILAGTSFGGPDTIAGLDTRPT